MHRKVWRLVGAGEALKATDEGRSAFVDAPSSVDRVKMSSDSLAAGGRRRFRVSLAVGRWFGSHTESIRLERFIRLAAACGCGGAQETSSGAPERPM